jgi:hypothetical protein
MATAKHQSHSSEYLTPPIIFDNKGRPHHINLDKDLHQLAIDRIVSGRDLKIIITAENSQTGVGKTTLAGWLALSWTRMFAGLDWRCNREEYGEGMATLDPKEYFKIVKKVGREYPAGTTIIVDDAEELDARRSMQNLNVEFSQRWMLMRLKQAITILTLPSPSSIDSRLEELADVWINVNRRGQALVHQIMVANYDTRDVMTRQTELIEWPDISGHPEMQTLQRMKEEKMDEWDKVDEDDEDDGVEYPIEDQVDFAEQIRDDRDCGWARIDNQDDHRLADKISYSGDYLRRKKKELEDDD